MKKSVAMKWVKALRSGKYKQGKGVLKSTKDNTYCCLGVLCEAVLKIPPVVDDCGACIFDGQYETLSLDALKLSGIEDAAGGLPKPLTYKGVSYDSLASLNDCAGWGFKRIATYIEKHYKKL